MYSKKIYLKFLERDIIKILLSVMENPSNWGEARIGWNRNKSKREILVRPASSLRGISGEDIWNVRIDNDRIFLALDSNPEMVASNLRETFPMKGSTKHTVGVLAVGIKESMGLFSGWIVEAGSSVFSPISSVEVVGAGIQSVSSVEAKRKAGGNKPADFVSRHFGADVYAEDIIRYSRTAGALGEENWEKLRSMRFAIVGAGRLGSLVFNSLVRTGISGISIIDPDRVEIHNIDAGDGLTREDVGEYKVVVETRNIKSALFPGKVLPEIIPVPSLLNSLSALQACKEADIIICCVDYDFPRFVTSFLGAVYMKPVIDIGTGIFHDDKGVRVMGADVRLFIPGDACIQCLGGTARRIRNRHLLTDPVREESFMRSRRWTDERLGSLRSLNQIAAHVGLRLIEDFVSGRISDSRWIQIEFSPDGKMATRNQEKGGRSWRSCLCGKVGAGDEGLSCLDKAEWKKMIRSFGF